MILTLIIWAIAVLAVTALLIPVAFAETLIWLAIGLIVLLILAIFDIIAYPLRKLYYKLYKKKK
jgi:hypothetical protein